MQLELNRYYRDGSRTVIKIIGLLFDTDEISYQIVDARNDPSTIGQAIIYSSAAISAAIVSEVVQTHPGGPWRDVDSAADSGPCRGNHEWINTGAIRGWCRHCAANAEWDRRTAMYVEVRR